MDLSKKKPVPVPKPKDVKIISMTPLLMPGNVVGALSLTFYGLGDDERVYLLQNDKVTWIAF